MIRWALHVEALVADLRTIFTLRLSAVVLYGRHAIGPWRPAPRRTRWSSCASSASATSRPARGDVAIWRRAHLAVPLLVVADEFERSLDAFPPEFGAILSRISRAARSRIRSTASAWIRSTSGAPAKWKRAGHLLHLREGFLGVRQGAQAGVAARGRLGAGAARRCW